MTTATAMALFILKIIIQENTTEKKGDYCCFGGEKGKTCFQVSTQPKT